MKRILFLTAFLAVTMGTLCFSSTKAQAKHIHATITATDGTVITVDGNYHFHLIPPEYVFTGTVTINALDGSTIVLHFKNSKIQGYALDNGSNSDLIVTLDSGNPCDVTQVIWSQGPSDLLTLLNSSEMNNKLVMQINSACPD